MEKLKWYALKVRGGREEKVKQSIEEMIQEHGLQDIITAIHVPMQRVHVTKDGKSKIKKQTFGFIIIAISDFNRQIKEALKLIPGMQGFWSHTGYGPSHEPALLAQEEIDRMFGYSQTSEDIPSAINLAEGEKIEIIDGLFKGTTAVITHINNKRKKIEAFIQFFGKKVKTELNYQQVKKV